jgi:glycosyltransferase involved in cell wall biosynthesis
MMSEDLRSVVTIGIPVYNEQKHLAKSVESAINQTYKEILILVSDNCSTDSSFKIAKEYEERDSRIKVYKQPKNIGTANFEFLLKKAETEYFCFLGGHDILKENFIEEALKIFNLNSKIVGVYPLVEYFKTDVIKKLNSNNKIVSAYPQVEFMELDVIFKENWGDRFNTLNLSTYQRISNVVEYILGGNSYYGVYKREIMLKTFFNDQIDGFGDLGAMLRTSLYGYIVPTSEVCSYFRITRHNETTEQLDTRYKSYNYPDNWRILHAIYPFTFIKRNKSLSFNEKIRLNIEVQGSIKKFYDLKWNKLLVYYLSRLDLKAFILILLSCSRFVFINSRRKLKVVISNLLNGNLLKKL